MREYGLLHLIGSDRVGILQEASAFVGRRGGTTEEGISHTLRSEAVVLLVVSGTAEELGVIARDASKLGESMGLLALFSKIKSSEVSDSLDALPLTLRISSPDFAGLLSTMTSFFSRHGLSIIGHHAHRSTLPHSQGLSTYRHKFTVLVPPEFKRKVFLIELDELAQQENFIRDDISHSDYY